MDLPKNEKTFSFDEVGEVTNEKYSGEFTVKCVLSMLDKRVLEMEKCRITGDIANPTPELQALAMILANLKVRIQKSPSWWEDSGFGNNLLDENIIVSLFDTVMDKEEEWRKELKDKASKEGN